MSSPEEYIHLSTLIQKLQGKDYYLTYAKNLLRASPDYETLPADNQLIEEMFKFFITTEELPLYINESLVIDEKIKSIALEKASENSDIQHDMGTEQEKEKHAIWQHEVQIKVSDLKKLYANKCIVFPKSLLR